jgi:hypothetical protein
MKEWVAFGLDGGNPLHALAALGLLRLGARLWPDLRMGWRRERASWHPFYHPVDEEAALIPPLAAALRVLADVGCADPALNRRVRDLSTSLKKAEKGRKTREREVRDESRCQGLGKEAMVDHVREALGPLESEIRNLEQDLAKARAALQEANGQGVAHVGDAIGVDPATFRRAGRIALESWTAVPSVGVDGPADAALVVAQLPALGCDIVQSSGKVAPTPFSFSNGSGGQYLLKDFRACAARVTPPLLLATLSGQGAASVDDATSLNWDPSDQVSYALVWQDPQSRPKATDVGANALAYLGLSLLPCVPTGQGLRAVGWAEAGGFVWPIWSPALSIDAVFSLLALVPSRGVVDVASLRARGVEEVRLAGKVNPDGKRNFFAPSAPLV